MAPTSCNCDVGGVPRAVCIQYNSLYANYHELFWDFWAFNRPQNRPRFDRASFVDEQLPLNLTEREYVTSAPCFKSILH